MGLLEDAIREHLELKRLRGADPAEVAREQQEALDPPSTGEPAARSEDQADLPADGAHAAGMAPTGDAPIHPDGAQEALAANDSTDVQETAELDMQAVLSDDATTAGASAPSAGSDAHEAQRQSSAGSDEEDSLEWEMPAASSGDTGMDSHRPEEENHDRAAHTGDQHQ